LVLASRSDSSAPAEVTEGAKLVGRERRKNARGHPKMTTEVSGMRGSSLAKFSSR